MSCRVRFWLLAHAAIEAGLLTHQEACIVARVGGRKNWAWGSHLARLKLILADRALARAGSALGAPT